MATLMSNECWSVLEVSIRCRDNAQEVLQAYNASVLPNNFRKLVFFIFYLSQNWVGVRTTPFARSDCTGVPFELLGWNFQRLSRIDWATKWRWQRFFCNFSSRIRWILRIILDRTMYEKNWKKQRKMFIGIIKTLSWHFQWSAPPPSPLHKIILSVLPLGVILQTNNKCDSIWGTQA